MDSAIGGSRGRPMYSLSELPNQGGCFMRRVIFALLFSALLSSSGGCFIPIYSGDPSRRTQELIFTSENLRDLLDLWERVWFLDQPDHLSPIRVHGGVL